MSFLCSASNEQKSAWSISRCTRRGGRRKRPESIGNETTRGFDECLLCSDTWFFN